MPVSRSLSNSARNSSGETSAAARAGAGYVRVSTSRSIDGLPSAVVQTDTAEINDPRVGAILVGPGLGDIPPVLTLALTVPKPVIATMSSSESSGPPKGVNPMKSSSTCQSRPSRIFGRP